MSTGFSFGNVGATATTQAATGLGGSSGFNFGQTAKTTNPTSGFSGFGAATATVKPTATVGSTGLNLTTGTQPGGFTLGGATGFGAASSTAASTTASTGLALPLGTGSSFNFGGSGGASTSTTTTQSTTGFSSFGATGALGGGAAKPATGLTLGSSGFGTGFGAATSTTGTATTGQTLGASKPNTGFSLGLGATSTSKPGLTLGGFGTAPTASTAGFSLGLGGSTAAAGTGSLFQSSTTGVASKGLGGIDPKTTAAATSGTNGKPGDSKAVKDTPMPNEVTGTVEEFKKYVKGQKSVREEIDRMSSKQMYKVQEEVSLLKQLLSLVSTGLQRNAIAIDKLKQESAQELKNAEMAQRTKDLPPGLQYENTAPTEYFARLVEDFEVRMVLYRQQIEEMESHLASLHQPSMLTPQELSILLSKIHESFIHLAAQLQVVHEAVKAQKEHYLNYRKVFHADSTDVFEKRRKACDKTKSNRPPTTVGPTPFTGMSNAAAIAMASALNRSQQPTGAPTLGLNTGLGTGTLGGQTTGLGTGLGTGLFGSTSTGTTSGLGTGFGSTTGFGSSTGFGSTAVGNQSTGFGSTGFNFGSTNTATVRPLGSSFGSVGTIQSSVFGSPAGGAQTTAFNPSGGATSQTAAFGAAPAVGFNLGATGGGFGVTDNKQPFQLQKPPAGKKGKKT